jgi:hypothetical protein
MKLNRNQLAKFLPDNEAIRGFEELMATADRAEQSAGVLSSISATATAPDTTLVSAGVSSSLALNSTYQFEFVGVYLVDSAGIGTRWVVDGPAAAVLAYTSEYSLTTTSKTYNSLTAYNEPAAANASSAATDGNVVRIVGVVRPSANGTLSIKFASGGVSAVNLVAGSLRVIRLT